MVLPLARSLQALAVLVAATLAINQPDLLELVVRVGYHWFVAGSCEDYPVPGVGGECYVRAVWGQEWNGSWEVFPVHEVLDLRWIAEIAGLGAWS